ncbi:MAG: TolC family protein, partial [Bryobacteraceae bacterium]
MTRIPLVITLGAVALLGGCVVGPKYKPPTVNTPPSFRGQEGAAQTASIADLPWWEVFQDQTLQGLVRTAIANNYDLRIAVRRVEQARELSIQARSQYYPGAGYEAGISRGKNEELGTPTPNSGKTTAAA